MLLANFRSLVKELREIRRELSRIADSLEVDLRDKGIAPPIPTKEESSVDYVDEELDWAREHIPNFDILVKRQEDSSTRK